MAIAQDKISELEDEVVTLVTLLLSSVADEGNAEPELATVTAQVERIGKAASDSGMQGLGDVCVLFANCLKKLLASDDTVIDEAREKLQAWPNHVMAYLDEPGNPDAAKALLEDLWDPIWHLDLPSDEMDILLDELFLVPEGRAGKEPASAVPAPQRPEHELIAEWDIDSDDDIPMPAESGALDDQIIPEPDASFDLDSDQLLMDDELSSSIVDEEMVGLLKHEIVQLSDLLALSLEHIEQSDDRKIRQEAFDDYMDALERLTAASMAVGLMGLHRFFSCLIANMEIIRDSENLTAHQHEILNIWPQRVTSYLNDLSSEEKSEHLVDLICDVRWPKPLNENNADTLVSLLSSVQQGVAVIQEESKRATHADADDVSLAVPDDINPELLETLLQELPTNTADFSAAIMQILEEGSFEGLDHAQRIAHTVKGAANTVGVRGIANVTHHLEDILSALSKAQVLPNRELAETLLSASDCLESMSESLVSMEPPPEETQEVLQDILDWANRIDKEGVPRGETVKLPAKAAPTRPNATTSTEEVTTGDAVQAVPMMRVQGSVIDDLLRLSGETMILTGQVKERLVNTFRQAQAVAQQNQHLQMVITELEDMIEMRGVSAPVAEKQRTNIEKTESNYDFDPLEFEQYNEVHSTIRKLVEMATDSGEMSRGVQGQLSSLNDLLEGLRRVNNENQESVLRTRMVPVKTIVPRLQRGVRQASRLTGKDVEMQVVGSETFIDSSILNDLVDPLMHILRNAVDHGIETADIRLGRDKPAKGLIVLAILREGSHIVVRCEDDGGGLDFESIRSTAIERGILGVEMNPSNEELTRMILSPGFSTRNEATQISGRGIGMDVVQNRISQMKGVMQIHTEPGLGSLIELRFPVSLLSTHALLVRAHGKVLAISERGVKQILYAGAGELRSLGGNMTYYLDDIVYPARNIEDLLNLPPDRRDDERHTRPVLLVEDETGEPHAIIVQEVFDSRHLVVKGMGEYVPKLRAIAGATILGDGSIVPVIDMPDLLREPGEISAGSEASLSQPAGLAQGLPIALVVDDSLSARRSMAQFMQDAGFQVRTAIDGFDAASIIDKMKPDIMLVDMEMPRMNGVELTSRVRADQKTKDIPIFMITSRSTEKHRQMAMDAGVNVYMTKPYGEDQLLEKIEQIMTRS